VILKRKPKRTEFTFNTYCDSIDRCLAGINKALASYDIDDPYPKREIALTALNYWSDMNLKIVTRRNREQLGMS
jgi:hypothetical protein